MHRVFSSLKQRWLNTESQNEGTEAHDEHMWHCFMQRNNTFYPSHPSWNKMLNCKGNRDSQYRFIYTVVLFIILIYIFPTKQLLPYSHLNYWMNSHFFTYRILCCACCTKMVFKLGPGQWQILSPFRNLTPVQFDSLHRSNAVNPWGYMSKWRLFP